MALRGFAANTTAGSTAASVVIPLQSTISNVATGNPTVITFTDAQPSNPYKVGTQMTFSGTSTATGLNGSTASVTAVGGAAGAWTASFSGLTTGGAGGADSGTMTVNIQTGDVIVIAAGAFANNAKTFPSGSVTISGVTQQAVTPSGGLNAYWDCELLVVSGTPPTSLTISGANTRWLAVAMIYSGRDNVNTFTSIWQGSPVATASSPVSVSLATSTSANSTDDVLCLIPMSTRQTGTNWVLTAPSGFADAVVSQYNTTCPVFANCDYVNNPGGAIGTLAATLTASGSNTGYSGWVFSLAQSGAASPPPQLVKQLYIMP